MFLKENSARTFRRTFGLKATDYRIGNDSSFAIGKLLRDFRTSVKYDAAALNSGAVLNRRVSRCGPMMRVKSEERQPNEY